MSVRGNWRYGRAWKRLTTLYGPSTAPPPPRITQPSVTSRHVVSRPRVRAVALPDTGPAGTIQPDIQNINDTDQGPVHGTCVWLCLLCLGVQTGNDVRESGRGTRGMTSHCCVWLCLRWLKFFRHRDTGTKVAFFGAFVTICARRLCPESWRGEGTRCG